MAPTGSPIPVAEQLAMSPIGAAALSTSTAGPFVYRTSPAGRGRQFVWFDRSGKPLGTVGDLDQAAPSNPSLSPDGRRVALDRVVNGNTDVWLLDIARGVRTRFTSDAAIENFPLWCPDGSRIVFHSNRKGAFDLYQKSATTVGSEEALLVTTQQKTPE